MHLTLIKSPRTLPGTLSPTTLSSLRSVLEGWLRLSARVPSPAHRQVLDRAITSIDRGTWLQDVARLPPIVLSAVRAAAMLAHLPEGGTLLSRWLLINRACLYVDPCVETCREVVQLNTTLDGVSGFEDDEPDSLAVISTALLQFHWEQFEA